MSRYNSLVLLVLIPLVGCATTQKKSQSIVQTTPSVPIEEATKIEKTELPPEETVKPPSDPTSTIAKKGIIFAKTDFQGILKTNYVKLLFEDIQDENNRFYLHIGEKSPNNPFPWDVKTVEPGYFYIDLPAGKYKVTSLSIPVGNAVAEEACDIRIEVIPGEISYVGTLSAVGTKEKIKLGGVPVIKPGFEYLAEVLDEREEAFEIFKQRFPELDDKITINLMKIIQQLDEGSPAPVEDVNKTEN